VDFLWESSHPTSKQEILKERPEIDPHPPKAISNQIDFSGGWRYHPNMLMAKHRNAAAKLALCVGLMQSTALAVTVAPNLLVNGDFENQPNWGKGVDGDSGFTLLTGAAMPGWTIEAGHGVTVHNTSLYPTISGNYSVNIDGEGMGGVNASFYQDFASAIGTLYALNFDWSIWGANTSPNLDVSVTDTTTSSVLYHGNFAWASGAHSESALFSGTGNALRLRIQESPSTGSNDNAYMVDNFSVAEAVPEPGSCAVMLVGLSLLGMVARRRRCNRP
jgi:hypothetical protein